MINRPILKAGSLKLALIKRKTGSEIEISKMTRWNELRTRTTLTKTCCTKNILSIWRKLKMSSCTPSMLKSIRHTIEQRSSSFKNTCCKKSIKNERLILKYSTNSIPQLQKLKPLPLCSNGKRQTSTLEWSLVGSVKTSFLLRWDRKNWKNWAHTLWKNLFSVLKILWCCWKQWKGRAKEVQVWRTKLWKHLSD